MDQDHEVLRSLYDKLEYLSFYWRWLPGVIQTVSGVINFDVKRQAVFMPPLPEYY